MLAMTPRTPARFEGRDRRRRLAYAAREQRLLITTNTDFGTILALSGVAGPSVLLLRGVGDPVDKRVDAVIHACQSSSGS
jgi:predicted nuclease of predicted toxin-antitoxin system